MGKIRDYEGQYQQSDYAQRLTRKNDTDFALDKFLCYDDPNALDLIFAEEDRRERLNA